MRQSPHRPCSRVALFLALVSWVWLAPASGQGTEPSTSSELRSHLPECPRLEEKEGRLILRSPAGSEWPILGISPQGDPLVESAIGPVGVTLELLQENRLEALDLLPKLCQVAQRAGVDPEGVRLRDVPLVGPHLSSGNRWVLPEGAAIRVEESAERPPSVLKDLIAALQPLVEQSELSALGRRSLRHLLELLEPGGVEDRNLTPTFARRLVRHGWLEGILGPAPEVAALRHAVEEAEALRAITTYRGEGLHISELKDHFGRGGWALRTPTRSGYAVLLPRPAYCEDLADLALVVDLSADVDPLETGAMPLGARVLHGGTVISSWTAEGGFAADLAAWRRAVPASGPDVPEQITMGFLPPHLLLQDLKGDVQLLITAHGHLRPPRDGSPDEVERFLAEAARALPDAAHLDLLGEYLFTYVLDSPDVRHPALVGCQEALGEIHQTVAQTLATVTGGICRGDCDDIAELYQAIASRQGRLSHIMELPSHNALGWAEQGEDGLWHTFVLQTGPPLEFTDSRLSLSLERAYRFFGLIDAFDPDQVPIAIRFSGENTRSSWVLSWRIFQERAYAEAMIDVQRDWHFHTYRRGISKMETMVAGGDQDSANYRELAGLCEVTGQYALAADHLRKAREVGGDPTLALAIRLVSALYQAKEMEAARAEAIRALEEELPDLAGKLGVASLTVALSLADTVTIVGHDAELGRRVVSETLLLPLQRQIIQTGSYVTGRRFDEDTWNHAPELQEVRRFLRACAGTITSVLREAKPEETARQYALRELTVPLDQWFQLVAFRDLEEQADVLFRYAQLGHYYDALLGKDILEPALASASPPEAPLPDFTRRAGTGAQIRADLPWIKIALPFHLGRLIELFAEDVTVLDRERVLLLGRAAELAHREAARLGLQNRTMEDQMELCRLIVALVSEDEAGLRRHLQHVRLQDDKGLRDDTARWLGSSARFLSSGWYDRVLTAWDEEVHFKPGYFMIAWSAALNHAPKHALMAARVAVRAFPDEPSFAEELGFMSGLLDVR